MLYTICGFSVLIVLVMLFIDFDYYMFFIFELYTILFFILVSNFGSSYERGRANSFIMFFGFVLRFGVVINNSMLVIRLMLVILRLAKLPIYRLHIWLPKVHVEASIIGSMVLARAVLKLRILYCWNFGDIILVRLLVIMSALVMLGVVDGKGFAAYSSVLHISLCVIFRLLLMLLVGYMHIVLSPLMFMTIYKIYNMNGSRFYMKMGLLIMILWLVNFRLPFVGSFFSEVYMMQYSRVILLILIIIYMVVGYVSMKSLNMDGKRLMYIPWLVLYILVI